MKNALLPLALAAASMVVGCQRTFVPVDRVAPGDYAAASVTSGEVVAAAKFAVAERAKASSDGALNLVKVIAAEQQVVAGMSYRLTLQVRQNGVVKAAEAIVWWQSWNPATPYRLTEWTWR